MNYTRNILLPHHREHLYDSGLTDKTIDAAEICSVEDPKEVKKLLLWLTDGSPSTPAIQFNYPHTDYIRLRPDNPRKIDGKSVKYEAPLGITPRIYVPKQIEPNIDDCSKDLWLTEGEKKALAGCQAGLATVAAPGVFCFHDARLRKEAKENEEDKWLLHPDLTPYCVPDRSLNIAFDSDIDTNPQVVRAASVLAKMITDSGMIANITYLPTGSNNKKMGLDDLYVYLKCNDAEFKHVLHEARRPTNPNEQIGWLKQRWNSLSSKEQECELRRAVFFARLFLSKDDYRHWLKDVAHKLKLPQRELKHITQEATRIFGEQWTSDKDWMTAPGYVVNTEGNRRGVWTTGNETKASRQITSAPINISEVGVDEHGTMYVTTRWRFGSEEHTLTVPRQTVAGSELLDLSSRGAPVNQFNCSAVQTFLQNQEQDNLGKIQRIKIFTQFGWNNALEAYVLGRDVIGIVGKSMAAADAKFLDALQPQGNARIYRELVLEMRNKSAVAELGWAAGYAGPIIRLLQKRSILLSIWGDSLGGKSAVQATAISPFGRPEGIKLTGDASPTAVEGYLSRCRDLITWVDDTQLTRSKELLKLLAYQVGSGTGRARGKPDGTVRQLANWLTIGFVSGEKPLMKLGVAAGAANRTLEIRTEPLGDVNFAKQIHQELNNHHGHTGRLYIESLLEQFIYNKNLNKLLEIHNQICRNLDPNPDEQSAHVGLLVTADFLARVLVFKEDEYKAKDAALRAGIEVLRLARSASDSRVDPVEAAYESIVSWVAENELAFQDGAQKKFGTIIEPKDADSKRVVAILTGPFGDLARKQEFDVQQVLHGLHDRGLLLSGERKGNGFRLGRKTPQLGKERPRAYWIVLEYEENPYSQTDPPSKGGQGTDGGTTKLENNQEVKLDCPTVPLKSDEQTNINKNLLTTEGEKKFPRELGTVENGGTVGQPEEEGEEENNKNKYYYIDTPALTSVTQSDFMSPYHGTEVGRAGHIEIVGIPSPRFKLIETHEKAAQACEDLDRHNVLGLDIETYAVGDNNDGKAALDPFRNKIRLIQLSNQNNSYLFDMLRLGALPNALRSVLNGTSKKVGHNLSFDSKNLLHHFGVEVVNPVDTYAGSVLVNGYINHREKGAYTLQSIVNKYLGISLPKEQAVSDWSQTQLTQEQLLYAARDSAVLLPLFEKLQSASTSAGIEQAWSIENNVIVPFAAMELAGIAIDRDRVQSLNKEWKHQAEEALQQVLGVLGEHVNVNSPSQLIAAFQKIYTVQLPSTAAKILENNFSHFPVVSPLLKYRRLSKQITSFFNNWLNASTLDGRIHASFHSLGCATGRMSCSNPNIQNVPRDSEIRSCFVPADGYVFINADYAAIELRVIAELIGDKELRRCFKENIDPHIRTAAFILKKEIQEITKDERQRAKPANFGFSFGQGVDRFMSYARDEYGVNFTQKEAASVRCDFFSLYKGIAAWHRRAGNEGPRHMKARTASGRIRKFEKFSFTEYLNMPIQGTAADGMKAALPLLHRRLKPLGARFVHLIHDEVIVETPTEKAKEAMRIVEKTLVEGMKNFLKEVPVVVEAKVTKAWSK